MNDEDYIDDFIREDSIETEETADKMFKELGYKLVEHKPYYCFFYKKLEEDCQEEEMYHIEFNYESKTVNKSYGDDQTVANITMQELQAINMKCRELKWI